MASMALRIGASGFSYDDWVGPFYPPGLKKTERFEYYAKIFDTVEINVSYYTWLSMTAVRSLVSRAPEGFAFSIKLHRSLTHEKDEKLEHGIVATIEQNKPMKDAGALIAQLAQFPNRFTPTAKNWGRIEKMAESLSPLALEFRNAEWQRDEVRARLAKLPVSLCAVDQPMLTGLLEFDDTVQGKLAYIRLHGRNAKMWYEHQHAWQRYDYLYSQLELSDLAEKVDKMNERAQDTVVYFNNHYGGQAVTNARQLAEKMGVTVGSVKSQRTLFEP